MSKPDVYVCVVSAGSAGRLFDAEVISDVMIRVSDGVIEGVKNRNGSLNDAKQVIERLLSAVPADVV